MDIPKVLTERVKHKKILTAHPMRIVLRKQQWLLTKAKHTSEKTKSKVGLRKPIRNTK